MTSDLITVGTSLAGVLIAIIVWGPKVMAAIRRDKLDGVVASTQTDMVNGIHLSYTEQLRALTARVTEMDAHIRRTDLMVHKQRVKLTRLQVSLIHLQGLLTLNGIEVPPHIRAEIDLIVRDESGDAETA